MLCGRKTSGTCDFDREQTAGVAGDFKAAENALHTWPCLRGNKHVYRTQRRGKVYGMCETEPTAFMEEKEKCLKNQ